METIREILWKPLITGCTVSAQSTKLLCPQQHEQNRHQVQSCSFCLTFLLLHDAKKGVQIRNDCGICVKISARDTAEPISLGLAGTTIQSALLHLRVWQPRILTQCWCQLCVGRISRTSGMRLRRASEHLPNATGRCFQVCPGGPFRAFCIRRNARVSIGGWGTDQVLTNAGPLYQCFNQQF